MMATAEQVRYHYDMDHGLFNSFLDKLYMVYSCGIWDKAKTLEQAQINKLERLARYSSINSNSIFLDIGCGWGGMCRYGLEALNAKRAIGITLSQSQKKYVDSLKIPCLEVRLEDWKDHAYKDEPYDSIVSIGAFEHFASRELRRYGKHRDTYREFFKSCNSLSKPKSFLGLQTIVTTKIPNTIESIKDSKFLLDSVFPGSALPTSSDIQISAGDIYQIKEWKSVGCDYVKTLEAWEGRLKLNKAKIAEMYGLMTYTHYENYFASAIRNFSGGYIDLVQISLQSI